MTQKTRHCRLAFAIKYLIIVFPVVQMYLLNRQPNIRNSLFKLYKRLACINLALFYWYMYSNLFRNYMVTQFSCNAHNLLLNNLPWPTLGFIVTVIKYNVIVGNCLDTVGTCMLRIEARHQTFQTIYGSNNYFRYTIQCSYQYSVCILNFYLFFDMKINFQWLKCFVTKW